MHFGSLARDASPAPSAQAVAATHQSPVSMLAGTSLPFIGVRGQNGPEYPAVRRPSFVQNLCSARVTDAVISGLVFSNDANESNTRNIMNWHLVPERAGDSTIDTIALAEAVASYRMTGVGTAAGSSHRWDGANKSGFNYTFFPCTRVSFQKETNSQKVDVNSFMVVYSSRPLTAMYEAMGFAPDFVPYTMMSDPGVTISIDMRLIGDQNSQKAIAAAVETVRPQNGWFLAFFPAVEPELVRYGMEWSKKNIYMQETGPAWQERPGERNKEMAARFVGKNMDPEAYMNWSTRYWRISGDSLGLAVAAAIAGLPSIHYTGYMAEFGARERLGDRFQMGGAGSHTSLMRTLPQGALIDSVDNIAWKALYCAVNSLPICIPLTAANSMNLLQLITIAANGFPVDSASPGRLPAARNALFIQIAQKAYTVDMGQEGVDYLATASPVLFVKTFQDVVHLSNLASAAYLWMNRGRLTGQQMDEQRSFENLLASKIRTSDGQDVSVDDLLKQHFKQKQAERKKKSESAEARALRAINAKTIKDPVERKRAKAELKLQQGKAQAAALVAKLTNRARNPLAQSVAQQRAAKAAQRAELNFKYATKQAQRPMSRTGKLVAAKFPGKQDFGAYRKKLVYETKTGKVRKYAKVSRKNVSPPFRVAKEGRFLRAREKAKQKYIATHPNYGQGRHVFGIRQRKGESAEQFAARKEMRDAGLRGAAISERGMAGFTGPWAPVEDKVAASKLAAAEKRLREAEILASQGINTTERQKSAREAIAQYKQLLGNTTYLTSVPSSLAAVGAAAPAPRASAVRLPELSESSDDDLVDATDGREASPDAAVSAGSRARPALSRSGLRAPSAQVFEELDMPVRVPGSVAPARSETRARSATGARGTTSFGIEDEEDRESRSLQGAGRFRSSGIWGDLWSGVKSVGADVGKAALGTAIGVGKQALQGKLAGLLGAKGRFRSAGQFGACGRY